MTAFKRLTIALLGADVSGKKSLAEALSQALAAVLAAIEPATSAATLQRHWQITTDAPLQCLLQRVVGAVSHLDGANLDFESTDFQTSLREQRRFDHTLLLGLDLAPTALAMHSQSADVRSHMDALLRRSLAQAGIPFQVIHGEGDERLRQALSALSALTPPSAEVKTPLSETSRPRKPWVWACDKCSDPVCEHRLLSDLLLNR